MTGNSSQTTSKLANFAIANIAVAAAIMALKYAAYAVSGSIALYSDALESIVNVVTAIAALIAIRIGAKPADEDHPFGHHKAEFFAAILEGALIIVAAILILLKAYVALRVGDFPEVSPLGMLISAITAVANGAWAYAMIRRGRTLQSPALEADGWHIVTDVVTTIGVIAGLLLVMATDLRFLDPLMAIAVALNVLWTGHRLALSSMSRLLDQAASPKVKDQIRTTIERNGHGALQAHDIRTRQAGRALFIEFHLVVPAAMTVGEAHVICDRLEDAIEADIAGSEVLIHVEPAHKAKVDAAGAINIENEPGPAT